MLCIWTLLRPDKTWLAAARASAVWEREVENKSGVEEGFTIAWLQNLLQVVYLTSKMLRPLAPK